MRVKHSALNERLGVRSLASMGSPPGPASALPAAPLPTRPGPWPWDGAVPKPLALLPPGGRWLQSPAPGL